MCARSLSLWATAQMASAAVAEATVTLDPAGLGEAGATAMEEEVSVRGPNRQDERPGRALELSVQYRRAVSGQAE